MNEKHNLRAMETKTGGSHKLKKLLIDIHHWGITLKHLSLKKEGKGLKALIWICKLTILLRVTLELTKILNQHKLTMEVKEFKITDNFFKSHILNI
jgi:hypothetical protein